MKEILALLIFSAIGFYLYLCGNAPVNINNITQKENTNNITQDEGDVMFYKISPSPTQSEYEDIFSKVREFVWEHWNSHRIGKVKLESYTKEGEKILTVFEIKKLDKDKRIINVEVERNYVDRNPKSKSFRKTYKDVKNYSARGVDRIEKSQNDSLKEQMIPQNIVRSGKSYFLRIKDSDGNTLLEF